jgi:hypothetical protein
VPRGLSGQVAAGVSDYNQVQRHAAQRLRRTAQAGEAEREQVLLVVGRDDDADGTDHPFRRSRKQPGSSVKAAGPPRGG